jgi:hypothetical protein
MKNRNMTWVLIVSFILIFGFAAMAHAAKPLPVTSSGNGQFVVQGNGLAEFEAIEVDIRYDAKALTNPRITQGDLISGMPMIINNTPGLFSYAGVDAFPKVRSGSGTLATITFDVVGTPSMLVTASGEFKDANGKDLTTNPLAGSGKSPVTKDDSGPKDALVAPPAAATGTQYPTYLGTVTMPDTGTTPMANINEDVSLQAEKIQKQTSDAAAKETAQQAATDEKNAPLTGSALERFRVFKGEKSPQSLIALFRSAMAGNSQEPHMALSDGKAIVKVFVNLPASSKSEPEFALKEAKLVSLNKSGDSTWVVEVLPNKGSLEASVIVLQDGKMAELPLTVAPPLAADPKTGEARVLNEADFAAFLKKRGTGNVTGSGLNSGGKHDYIDDYIYTANFLAQSDAATTAAEKIPQGGK